MTDLLTCGPDVPASPVRKPAGFGRPGRAAVIALAAALLLALGAGGLYASWNSWAPVRPGIYPAKMFYYMGGTTSSEFSLRLLWVKRNLLETRPPAILRLELLDEDGEVVLARPLPFRPEGGGGVLTRRGSLLFVSFDRETMPSAKTTARFLRLRLQGEEPRTYDIGAVCFDPQPGREHQQDEPTLTCYPWPDQGRFFMTFHNRGDAAVTVTRVEMPMPGLSADFLARCAPVAKWLPEASGGQPSYDPSAKAIEWRFPLRLEPHSNTEVCLTLPDDVRPKLAETFWYLAPAAYFSCERGEQLVLHNGWGDGAGSVPERQLWRYFSTAPVEEGER